MYSNIHTLKNKIMTTATTRRDITTKEEMVMVAREIAEDIKESIAHFKDPLSVTVVESDDEMTFVKVTDEKEYEFMSITELVILMDVYYRWKRLYPSNLNGWMETEKRTACGIELACPVLRINVQRRAM